MRRGPKTCHFFERISWFHSQVQAGRYPNASLLSERFEISQRTAYRDISFLRDRFCAPLRFDRQRNGFIYADKSFTLPGLMLTEGELVAIFLAERVLEQYRGTPYERYLRTAFQKLCQLLPEHVSLDVCSFEALSFELGPTRPVELEIYSNVLKAIQDNAQLLIRYYAASRGKESKRIVDPYHLHNMAGDWYLIAFDQKRKGMRDFALSRIRAIEPTGKTFQIRPDFNRANYLRNHFAGYRGGEPIEAVIRFDSYQARWIREKQWPGEIGREEKSDGTFILKLMVPNLEAVMRWVMQYGSHAEVLEPKELRLALFDETKILTKLYGQFSGKIGHLSFKQCRNWASS